MFDFIYDWIIHFVPNWLRWILMTPLLVLVILMLIQIIWPGSIVPKAANDSIADSAPSVNEV